MVSKSMAASLSSAASDIPHKKEFNYFVKRLKPMNQDLVCLDSASGKLAIYSGGTTLIHKIDPAKLLPSVSTNPLGLRATELSHPSDSNLQLHFSDGS